MFVLHSFVFTYLPCRNYRYRERLETLRARTQAEIISYVFLLRPQFFVVLRDFIILTVTVDEIYGQPVNKLCLLAADNEVFELFESLGQFGNENLYRGVNVRREFRFVWVRVRVNLFGNCNCLGQRSERFLRVHLKQFRSLHYLWVNFLL